jgi:predicted transcriptional regulator
METSKDQQRTFALLTAQIVAAYLSNHPVVLTEVPGVISSVHAALRGAVIPAAKSEDPPIPRVPVKRSVTPDYLVCLEDGMHVRMLKRHLRTRHNLTPEEYRTKWRLPGNYPMIAPSYREARSALARSSGLGRRREPAPEPAPKAEEKPRRGRRKK